MTARLRLMARVLVAASWLQFPGGNLFVIHFCSFDREWDGFRHEIVTRDWIEAAHVLRVVLPSEKLGDVIELLKHEGQVPVIATMSDRLQILGLKPPDMPNVYPLDVPRYEKVIPF